MKQLSRVSLASNKAVVLFAYCMPQAGYDAKVVITHSSQFSNSLPHFLVSLIHFLSSVTY